MPLQLKVSELSCGQMNRVGHCYTGSHRPFHKVGVCLSGPPGQTPPPPGQTTPPTHQADGQQAGSSMHPTGMHSCLLCYFVHDHHNNARYNKVHSLLGI